MTRSNLDNLHNDVPSDYYQMGIKNNIFQRYWHSRRFNEIKKLLENEKPYNMLDVGCHSGKFTFEMSKKIPSTKIYGIDISKDAIRYAQSRYKKINFRIASGEKLPFKNSTFDMVTCLEVMEHIQSPNLVLKEIKRVVKKRGKVIILVPSENLLFKIIWFLWINFGPGRVWSHTHVNKFTNDKLDTLLKKNQFRILNKKIFILKMLLAIKAEKL